MKLKFFLIVILNILLISCSKEERVMNQRNKIEQKLLLKTTKQLETEKQLNFTGFGGSSDKGLTMLSLSFETDKNYDIPSGRELILYCVEVFLQNINSDEKIRPYLQDYPFDLKNIEISVYHQNENNLNNKLEIISLSHGSIRYYIRDENKKLIIIHVETYEEALKIVQSQK